MLLTRPIFGMRPTFRVFMAPMVKVRCDHSFAHSPNMAIIDDQLGSFFIQAYFGHFYKSERQLQREKEGKYYLHF